MAHRVCGVPLVIWTLMAYLYMVHHSYIAVAHHIRGAPLMSILAIAVFLVVCSGMNPAVAGNRGHLWD